MTATQSFKFHQQRALGAQKRPQYLKIEQALLFHAK